MNRSKRLIITAVLLLSGAPLGLAEPTAPTLNAADAAQQNVEIQKLLRQYRAAGTTAEQKATIVGQLLEIGSLGPQQLAVNVERDFSSKAPAYLTKFEKSAKDALRAAWKGQGDIEKEVQRLRATVLDVSHTADLTKERIVSKADPAMKRLEELLTTDPAKVQAFAADLKTQRQELVDMVDVWHKAADRVPEPLRKKLTPLPPSDVFENVLTGNEQLASLMATPMTPADRSVLIGNLTLAKSLDPEEGKGVLILNMMRIRLGLRANAIDLKLCEAGRGHSSDMKERKFFDHASPVPGKATPWDRAKLAGSTADAENIFMGSPSGASAIEAWWHSPGHHKNMIADHHRTGLGRTDTHWTQMFGD